MRLSESEAGNGNRSTLEELLRGNIAGLPEIVEPTQSQTNADEAEMPVELEWATTEYLYDLTQEYYQVISETTTGVDGASATTAYAYGLERIAAYTADSKTSYVYDGRGSVAQTVTAPVAGESVTSALPDVSVKVHTFSYTAFGEQTGAVKASGFTYNAEAYDAATGMLNLRARQYEPVLNRFSQKDISQGLITSPILANRYLYVKNNPIVFSDASGMFLSAVVNGIKSTVKIIKKVIKEVKAIKTTGKTTSGSSVRQIINRSLTNAYDIIVSKGGTLTDEMKLYIKKKQGELDALGTLTSENIDTANRILMSMCSVLLEKERYNTDYYADYLGESQYADRETWGAAPRNDDDMTPIGGSIQSYYNTIVIHHTDGPLEATPQNVQQEHLKRVEVI